jgi:hypothetical protein
MDTQARKKHSIVYTNSLLTPSNVYSVNQTPRNSNQMYGTVTCGESLDPITPTSAIEGLTPFLNKNKKYKQFLFADDHLASRLIKKGSL